MHSKRPLGYLETQRHRENFLMSLGHWFGGEGLPKFMLMVWYFEQLITHIIWRTLVINTIMPKFNFNVSFYFSFIYLCFTLFQNLFEMWLLFGMFLFALSLHSPKQKITGRMLFSSWVLWKIHFSEVKHLPSFGPTLDFTYFFTTLRYLPVAARTVEWNLL